MKSYKQLIKIVSIPASAIAICFGVVSCGTKEYKAKESWTIMVYMCGSDLESRSGLASMDLIEMMNANIPTNFQILVETGGAENWFNTTSSPIRNDAIQRWRIGHKKMDLISELPLVSMADGSTLTDFLEWGMLEAWWWMKWCLFR